MEETDTDRPSDGELPTGVVAEAERLTRRARETVDDRERAGALRTRDRLLADHEFTARVREDDTGAVLVLYPAEWVENDTVRPERIDDTNRGVERSLSGAGTDDWETVDSHNRELVAAVRQTHGDTHGANATALADFAGNHYAKRIESLTSEELRLFLDEYYPRNAWPTDDQRAVVGASIQLVFEQTAASVPTRRLR